MVHFTEINPMYNENTFTLSGTSELLPVIETSKNGNRYAKLYLVQSRYAGPEYKEFKRYYTIVIFDEMTIQLLEVQDKQFKCTVKGEFNVGKSGQYYQTNLVGKRITIDEVLDVDFKDKVKTQGEFRNRAAQEVTTKKQVILDDEDLPF